MGINVLKGAKRDNCYKRIHDTVIIRKGRQQMAESRRYGTIIIAVNERRSAPGILTSGDKVAGEEDAKEASYARRFAAVQRVTVTWLSLHGCRYQCLPGERYRAIRLHY